MVNLDNNFIKENKNIVHGLKEINGNKYMSLSMWKKKQKNH